jgi:DNA-binding beta-propeller fold protein YncE
MKHHEHDSNGTCPDCQIAPFIRNNYFTGKLMTARDFFTEQEYFSSKLAHHHQRLHGWGIVCGLDVVQHGVPECRERYVIVKPGTAIDCCGREILVTEDETLELKRFEAVKALADQPDDKDHRLQICIRYRECPTEEVPVLYDDCGCDETQCAPNRILESYEFDILVDQPLQAAEVHSPVLKRYSTANPPHATRVALHAVQAAGAHLYVLAADNANNKTVFQLETQSYGVVGTHALPSKGLELAISQDGSRMYVVIENPSGQAGDPRQLVVVDTAALSNPSVRVVDIPGSANSPVYLAALSTGGALIALVGTTGDLHLWPTSLNDPGPNPTPETKNLGPNLSSLVLSSNGQYACTADATNNRLVRYDISSKVVGEIKVTSGGANPSALALVASSGPDLLAVVSPADKKLYLVEPETPSLLGFADLPYTPLDVGVSPGGAWAYVLEDDGTQSFVQVVSLRQMQQKLPILLSAPFAVGPNSREVIVSSSGKRLYVPFEDDLTLLGRGGVAVLEVNEQRCLDLLYGPCPECDSVDCVILATIENYHPGFSVVDMGDSPTDPVADRTAKMARIDNRLGRKMLPSVQALAEAVECMLERESGGPGTQGPPGPPGLPGNPGPGIDDVFIEWIPCGQDPAQPRIRVNPDGTRTLVLQIPDGCQDLVVKNVRGKCGEPGSGRIEIIEGQRTLVITMPPPLTDVEILNNCEEDPYGVVKEERGRCKLVLNIPRDCEQPPSEGRSTTGIVTITANKDGKRVQSSKIGHCLGNVPVGLMLAEDIVECDMFEAVNFIGPLSSLTLLRACVSKPYDGTFVIEIAQQPIDVDRDYNIRWVAVAGTECQLDLNRASREELVALPGINDEIADAIIARRERQPFTSPRELLEISGIGDKKLQKLLPAITVG